MRRPKIRVHTLHDLMKNSNLCPFSVVNRLFIWWRCTLVTSRKVCLFFQPISAGEMSTPPGHLLNLSVRVYAFLSPRSNEFKWVQINLNSGTRLYTIFFPREIGKNLEYKALLGPRMVPTITKSERLIIRYEWPSSFLNRHNYSSGIFNFIGVKICRKDLPGSGHVNYRVGGSRRHCRLASFRLWWQIRALRITIM